MTTMILMLTTLALASFALGYGVFRLIRSDGYGSTAHRPPPSHPRDVFDPTMGPQRLA